MAANLFDEESEPKTTLGLVSHHIFASKDTTEHPHKLSSLIVKERFAASAKRPAFYRTLKLCQLILERIFNKVLRS